MPYIHDTKKSEDTSRVFYWAKSEPNFAKNESKF